MQVSVMNQILAQLPSSRFSFNGDQKVASLDLGTGIDVNFSHSAVSFGGDDRLHFHRFQHQQFLALDHFVAGLNRYVDDHSRHR